LDVIAVPWTENAVSADTLVDALCAAIDGWRGDKHPGELRAHGRRCWMIHFETGGYDTIDLSVMPRNTD
jgi:hypothetical protein